MKSNMTSGAKHLQIFETVVEWIVVLVMNVQLLFGPALFARFLFDLPARSIVPCAFVCEG